MSLQTQCNHQENSKVIFHSNGEKNTEIIMETEENLNSPRISEQKEQCCGGGTNNVYTCK
jgi:hypothetical protein